MAKLSHIFSLILAVGIFLCCPAAVWADGISDLIINEIQVANIDQFVDPSWNYGGWVEFYNRGSLPRQLRGYWISDDPANLKKGRTRIFPWQPTQAMHDRIN